MGFTVKTLHSCEAVNDRRVSGGEGTGRPTPVHQAKCPRCVYVISVCVCMGCMSMCVCVSVYDKYVCLWCVFVCGYAVCLWCM